MYLKASMQALVLLILTLNCIHCSDLQSKDKHPKDQHPKKAKEADKLFFGGLFPGKCSRDAVYIRDAYSLVFCSNNNKYVQPCAPGTRNGPLHAYLPGAKYGSTDFCNVNLIPYGSSPYMYPIQQYGGLPLPFEHTRRDGYMPYLFFPKQFQLYQRPNKQFQASPHNAGYLRPLDGYNVVNSIKDTHLYEKPDAVHGFPSNDKEKDYHAIKASYKLQKFEKDFKNAYNQVEKEINDDYKPQYKDEFDKFSKSYNGHENTDNEYKLGPTKVNSYDGPKPAKKITYKETKYEPPMLQPNKYGEVKDIPVKFKTQPPKYVSTKPYVSKYDAEKAKPPKHAPSKYDAHKYDSHKNDKVREFHEPDFDDTYHAPKYDRRHDSPKYESPPFEPSKKIYKPVGEDDREFDLFYNYNGNPKVKGATYSDDTFGEYGVGYVEKSKGKSNLPLQEKIHGSHYISEATKVDY